VTELTHPAGRTRRYRPARPVLPHAAAAMVTFTASGLAHNLPGRPPEPSSQPVRDGVAHPLRGGHVASEALHMDLSRLPAPARVVVNLAYLIGCYKLVGPLLP
jgi:hypothetical protein